MTYFIVKAIDQVLKEEFRETAKFRLLKDYAAYLSLPENARAVVGSLGRLPTAPTLESISEELGLSKEALVKAIRYLEFEKFVRMRKGRVEVLSPLMGLIAVFVTAEELAVRARPALRTRT